MKSSYTPFDTFVFRTPLFPFNHTDKGMGIDSEVFREAIFLASPELYEGNNSSDSKKIEKFELSLTKYYQRARTRCTPFGLFAGCSVGKWGDETKIELESIDQYRRCTRLDMQYLCALIQQIERMPEVKCQLTYYPNDSLYKIGGKYRYIEYRYQKSQRQHEVISLEIDEPLETLLTAAAGGATVQELVDTLVTDDITAEDAEAYVYEVIDSQVLKSDLDPCVVGEDVLGTLIEKLSCLKEVDVLEPLCRIQSLLSRIDSLPVGTTLPIYAEITDLVKGIGVGYEAKFLFQTDMFKPVNDACVSKSVAKRLSELISFLSKVTVPGEMQVLSEFTRAFQERYEEREVPLAEVMDRELGIGYPRETSNSGDVSPLINDLGLPAQRGYITELRQTPLDKVLFRKYIDCIRNGDNAVQLTADDFKDFSFEHQLPDTISVMCSMVNPEQLYVSSVGGSCGANILGRFCHLDRDIKEFVEQVADFGQKNNPDLIYAEISHLPESRIGNIASRPAFRDYTLHYLSNCSHSESDIPVSDLMLSVRRGRLYLRSVKYNKEVVPRLTCAHNYSLSPIPVYRFLSDMQYQGKTGGLRCGWNGSIAEMEYQPRIVYKDIILARQQWKVKQEEVAGFEKLSDEALLDHVKVLMAKRKLPERVIVPDADNELFLELSDVKCLRLLLSIISKRKGVVLEEFLFDPANAVVYQGSNRYTNEMIFVFHK